MCGGSKPKAQTPIYYPAPAEAEVEIDPKTEKKIRKGKETTRTILTGPLGTNDEATVGKQTLLGG